MVASEFVCENDNLRDVHLTKDEPWLAIECRPLPYWLLKLPGSRAWRKSFIACANLPNSVAAREDSLHKVFNGGAQYRKDESTMANETGNMQVRGDGGELDVCEEKGMLRF